MSKIQKALKALSESQKKRGLVEFEIASDAELKQNAQYSPPSSERSPVVGKPADLRRSKSTSIDGESEPIATHRIEIRLDEIEKAGLYPNRENLDVVAQQFRRIKRPIIKAAFDADLPIGKNANVVMMASALPGAGKSFCSFNLAQSIALEREIGAVLVDADVLKPGISRSLDLESNVGLIDYLIDDSIKLEDILVQSDFHDIVFIPAGSRHPQATELLASRRMLDLVGLLSVRYRSRAVIFDTPPLLITNEAQALAEIMGQIVLVIEARISTQESVIRALGMLDRQKPINAILNKSRSANGSGYQSDDYGYYPSGAD